MAADRRQAGFTLIELATVVAIIGIFAAIAAPQLSQWLANQRVKSAARDLGNIFTIARSEAIRTGNNHVVFFMAPNIGIQDPVGNPVADSNGNAVAALLLNDGPAATANCTIDLGEEVDYVRPSQGVTWGAAQAAVRAPLDSATTPMADGVTFLDPTSPANAVNWVLFRPDGIPAGFSGDFATGCGTIGGTGTGRGAGYVTNGSRDYAIVLTALGGVRLHVWDGATNQWSN